jgi:hypothetical protein
MTRRHADVFRLLRRFILAYRALYWSLLRYYRRKTHRPLTPEQEVARDISRMHREQEALRRLTWRR